MKYLKLTLGILGVMVLMVSCKKEELVPFESKKATSDNAYLKIVYSSAYTVNYRVYLKVNNVKMSNTITYSTPFPGGGLNTGGGSLPDYLEINPGNAEIAVIMTKNLVTEDSLTLSKNSVKLDAGKYYTVYLSDTSSSTKAYLHTENKEAVKGDFSRFKFVNTIPNSTGLDLYFGTTKVASNIAYNQASPEFTVPRGAVDKWYIRAAGAAPESAAIVSYPTTNTFMTIPFGRIMGVYARGYLGSTGTLAPAVSLLYN